MRQKLKEFRNKPTVPKEAAGQTNEVIERSQRLRIQHLRKEIRNFIQAIRDLEGQA